MDIIAAMYASMCFDKGGRPDWTRLAEVFAPNARLVRITDDGVFAFDPTTFRENIERMIESGALESFSEQEIWRETREFADFSHVLSVYETRASRDGELLNRAVKSIQLYRQAGRWRISAMLWRREGRDFRIPDTAWDELRAL